MTTKTDDIVAEIRRRREAHAALFDYDLKQIVEDYQRQERDSGREFVSREPRKPTTVRRES